MASEPPSIELFVRSLGPKEASDRTAAVLARLDRLAETGQIADFDVTVWGRRISPDHPAARTDTGGYLLDRLEAIHEWADERDATVDEVFDRRILDRDLADESAVWTDLPPMALVESTGRAVSFVAPHDRDGERVTIEDRLDDLAADAASRAGEASRATAD